jgi:hypothetical protein
MNLKISELVLHLSGLLSVRTLSKYSKEHSVSENVYFHSRVQGWEVPAFLGLPERANLSDWIFLAFQLNPID